MQNGLFLNFRKIGQNFTLTRRGHPPEIFASFLHVMDIRLSTKRKKENDGFLKYLRLKTEVEHHPVKNIF